MAALTEPPQESAVGWRDAERTMKRIVAAVDGSDGALAAVSSAATLAAALDAEMVLIAVAQPVPIHGDPGWQAYADAEHLAEIPPEMLPRVTNDHLEEARGRAIAAGAKRIRMVARSGDPATEIIAQIRDEKAEIVVVGSRGLGRLSGLLLGSVSQKLALSAPCSVLIVRRPVEPPAN